MELKLWILNKKQKDKYGPSEIVMTNELETEELLENMIVDNPELLESDLKLIGRQTPASGGALDLLAIDKDGNFVIFELKKGKLVREAVSQIIDYASFLTDLDTVSLSKHISDCSGTKGVDEIEDFESWYQEQFSKEIEEIKENPPRMTLVGLGYDEKVERMVKFLANSGLNIKKIEGSGLHI
ncbi:Endonuclease NucS [subsurface metagenome]